MKKPLDDAINWQPAGCWQRYLQLNYPNTHIIAEMGVAVESGKLSAEEATHSTIQQLQEALGDQLVVE